MLIRQIHWYEYADAAQQLDYLLDRTARTTASELLGEIGSQILAFERSTQEIAPELQDSLNRCMATVRQIWPDIN